MSGSGKALWAVSVKEAESRAVAVPSLEGGAVPDLLIAALPPDGVRKTHTHPLTHKSVLCCFVSEGSEMTFLTKF